MRAAYSAALAALRTGRPEAAERQLRAIQAAAPGEVNSLRLLGVALLAQGMRAPTLRAHTVRRGAWMLRARSCNSY